MADDEEANDGIAGLARDWGWVLGKDQLGSIAAFFRLLLAWNRSINLTGAQSLGELVKEHMPDSFAMAGLAPAHSRVVDVGAGGGLPGIPFALLRADCRVTLVEPRAKRAAFLNAASRSARNRLSLEVLRQRDEALPSGAFDVAASRATFAPGEWLARGSRLVRRDGLILVFAAAPLEEPASSWRLEGATSYSTGSGASRWAGVYVVRRTLPAALANG
jgi:16S rRNA (guanine527-N7)-methyltransferase